MGDCFTKNHQPHHHKEIRPTHIYMENALLNLNRTVMQGWENSALKINNTVVQGCANVVRTYIRTYVRTYVRTYGHKKLRTAT